MKKLLGIRSSSARLSGGRLVLTLSNALTPVTWVIDMEKSPAFLLKVTETNERLFILQKLHLDAKGGEREEDLAYFAKKADALDAMEKAASAMNAGDTAGQGGWYMRRVRPMLHGVAFVAVCFLLVYVTSMDLSLYRSATTVLMDGLPPTRAEREAAVAAQAQAQVPAPAPAPIAPASNPNAVGTPLSADDFFESRGPAGGGLPFAF